MKIPWHRNRSQNAQSSQAVWATNPVLRKQMVALRSRCLLQGNPYFAAPAYVGSQTYSHKYGMGEWRCRRVCYVCAMIFNILLIQGDPKDAQIVRDALDNNSDQEFQIDWVKSAGLGLERLAALSPNHRDGPT